MTSPLLAAATPAQWLDSHLDAFFGGPVAPADPTEVARGRWLVVTDLLAEDGEVLRSMADRLSARRQLPRPAAATYVASWTGGTLAGALGFTLAAAAAGVVVSAATVRWHQHPDGWMDRVDLSGARIVVAEDHPWSGLPGVDTVPNAGEVGRQAVVAMVALLTPVIDACHRLARIGKAGLWNEVADGLGMSVAYQPTLPVHQRAVDVLNDAVRCPSAPWKSHPEIRIVDGPTGAIYVGQKGGCCLVYTRAGHGLDVGAKDPEKRDQPDYCSTCSLRDRADCEARQLVWIGRQRASQPPGN